MPLDYVAGTEVLETAFAEIAESLINRQAPQIAQSEVPLFDTLFKSRTQAYRETLLGCALARLQDRKINIRLPYINQGNTAYNGRTLDERVVNPFLQRHRIPCSRGPFLSAFLRSVRFDATTEQGLRDKVGYRAFLNLISGLETSTTDSELFDFIKYLLYRFALLREAAQVTLVKVAKNQP